MSGVGGEEEVEEYESDPEESKAPLSLRRRVASDDEDDDDEEEGAAVERETDSPPRRVHSDEQQSDGEGEADEEEEEEYYDDEGEEEEEEEESEDYRELDEERGGDDVAKESVVGGEVAAATEEEGKKENEPFAVPTAGAFYMHDDRFRNTARGRGRRMLGGRKLWESQNESKWGHDKFEEITVQDRHYNEGPRNPRGRYRARGKNRGGGNPRGDKSKVYQTYNQNQVPKITKGRGFRKYDSLKGNKNEAPQMRYRPRSNKAVENPTHSNSGRAPTASQDLESGPVSSTKQAFASSLNSASPPFYPSSSSTKETTTWVQKRDPPPGNINRDVEENATRGRNGVDSVSMNKLHINDHISSNSGKNSTGIVNSANPRAQGRGVSYQTETIPHNQSMRASTPSHFQQVQRNSVQSGRQASSIHQSRQFRASGSQSASNLNTFEHGESNSYSDTNKFKSALVTKEKGGLQGGGKGSFMYGGSQVMAVSAKLGGGRGDQNFGAAPTFSLPVMPFGGQHHHPGGMGVPAVGMAFPGYVAQPNGLGNTEMTWLPILAGSAYGSPYLASALESAYPSRTSPQLTSSSVGASSKEDDNSNEWKSSQTPEVSNDAEVGQRQKISRRYTEMKFE